MALNEPSPLSQSLAEEELDLRVYASYPPPRQPLDFVPKLGTHPQYEGLSFRHGKV